MDKGLGREGGLVIPGSDGEWSVVRTRRARLGVPWGMGRASWVAVTAIHIDLRIYALSYSN